LPAAEAGKGIHIHAVAGGGCGEATLRRLALCGYTLSCGVVSQGDMDAEVGAVLGVKLALEKPFFPISREAIQAAQKLAFQADALVLTPIPFGTGNLLNLELLESALTAGTPVFIASGIGNRDYTPTRQAEAWVQALIDRGAKPYQDVTELLTLLPSKSG
jgi:iron complex transport system ATP-binding protein